MAPTLLGPVQAFSRALFADLTLPGREAEFFALYEVTRALKKMSLKPVVLCPARIHAKHESRLFLCSTCYLHIYVKVRSIYMFVDFFCMTHAW